MDENNLQQSSLEKKSLPPSEDQPKKCGASSYSDLDFISSFSFLLFPLMIIIFIYLLSCPSNFLIGFLSGIFTVCSLLLLLFYCLLRYLNFHNQTTVSAPVASSTPSPSLPTSHRKESYSSSSVESNSLGNELDSPPFTTCIKPATKGTIMLATEWDGRKHNGRLFYGVLRTNLLLLSKSEENSREIDTTILLEGCLVSLLPENGEESIRFSHRYPISISHPTRILWGPKNTRIYIFVKPSREKEVWYRSLIGAQEFVDKELEQKKNTILTEYFDYMFNLQHRSQRVENFGLTWFNIFVGRVYWDMKTNREIVSGIATRIQKALDRMHTPSYLGKIYLKDMQIGHSLPLVTKIYSVVSDYRGVKADVNIDYNGSFLITLEAHVQLEKKLEKDGKSTGFSFRKLVNKIVTQVNETPLTLSVQVNTLSGKMQMLISQPPTDRLWFGFYILPEMDWTVKAIIGQRFIKIVKVTDFLEKQLRKEFAKVFVLPNMDDVRIKAMSDCEASDRDIIQDVIASLHSRQDLNDTKECIDDSLEIPDMVSLEPPKPSQNHLQLPTTSTPTPPFSNRPTSFVETPQDTWIESVGQFSSSTDSLMN